MKRSIFVSWIFAATIATAALLAAPTMMSAQSGGADAATVEAQKETSRKSIQWWDSRFDVDPDTLFAPGYINNQEPVAATDFEKGVNLDELKRIIASYHAAFPGTEVEFKMQVVEGNRVATQWTFTGTQKGPYEGLAPTDKTVTWAGISIDEYDADGKIAETWVVWDKYTLFSALGLTD
ncbi:MAG: ester cyclase [Pseudomonadota bacterium]